MRSRLRPWNEERGQGTISEFDPTFSTIVDQCFGRSTSSLRGPLSCHGLAVMGWLSWVGQTGETGLSPRPSEAIGHCPWKPWMNAACVPVFESGDGCPREILVTSSSGRPHPTRWREWQAPEPPKATLPSASSLGAAPFRRTATHRHALNPAMHPKSEIIS